MMSERECIYADRTFYQKSGGKSYLVIRSGEEPKLPYQINMIRYNKISGLLPIQFFIEDGEYRYFYDVSGKESLAEKMKQKKYSIMEIRTIMSDLYQCVQQMEEYLLDTNYLILEPEYMFSEKNTLDIQFCFYQDKVNSFEKSLEGLFEYFMNRLDYQDEKTVLLAYGLYQKSREEHISLSELMKQFCDVQSTASEPQRYRQTGSIEEREEEDSSFRREEAGEEILTLKRDRIYAIPKWIPYIPDMIGGYGIARILWYIRKNHMQMSGKTFMIWMFVLAGILAGCGVLSTILSRYLDQRLKKVHDERLEEAQEEKVEKEQEECLNRRNVTVKKQEESTEEYPARIRIQQSEKKESEMNLFDELRFWDESEMEDDVSKSHTQMDMERETAENTAKAMSAVPATVVMREPELFRAFNPVLVSKNKEKFQDILLKDRSMVIGKVHGIADICLEGKGISRIHARINQDKRGCSVTDLGSTNGTFVNGIQLQERKKKYLEKGDEVRFAEAVYEFLPAENENVRSHQISDVI